MKIKVGIVEDFPMIRDGLKLILNNYKEFNVVIEAAHGKDLLAKLSVAQSLPEIILVDINMPVMDGFETVRQLQMAYPKIKCIALSVNDDFVSVFKMINAGVKAYLLKDSQPDRIKEALLRVYQQGVYYDGFVVQKIMDFQTAAATKNPLEKSSVGHDFSNREIDFIRYCCSELSYKEIAEKMGVSSRTVDGYRDSVFTKLGIKSRVSVVLYAVDSGIYMPAHVFATN